MATGYACTVNGAIRVDTVSPTYAFASFLVFHFEFIPMFSCSLAPCLVAHSFPILLAISSIRNTPTRKPRPAYQRATSFCSMVIVGPQQRSNSKTKNAADNHCGPHL